MRDDVREEAGGRGTYSLRWYVYPRSVNSSITSSGSFPNTLTAYTPGTYLSVASERRDRPIRVSQQDIWREDPEEKRKEADAPVLCHLLTQLPSFMTPITPSNWADVHVVTLSDDPFIWRISSQFGQPSLRKSDEGMRIEHSRQARLRRELVTGAGSPDMVSRAGVRWEG